MIQQSPFQYLPKINENRILKDIVSLNPKIGETLMGKHSK